jgi:hypothetical protein
MSVAANEPGSTESGVIDQGFGMMNGGEPNPQGVSSQPQLPGTEQTQQEKMNPAWESMLSKLPQGLHGLVTPDLKQWDQNYQQGIQQVHSQYEGYKPFLEQGVNPEALNNALLVQQALEANPEQFIRTVAEYYNLQLGEQGQTDQQEELTGDEEGLPFDITQDPRFQQYQQMTELMAQQMLTQNQQQQDAVMDQQVESEFAAAREKLGDFNENLVIQQMLITGQSVEEAAQTVNEMIQGEVAKHRNPGANAPIIMGSGGGLPSQQTPVSDLSPQDRRSLVAQRLAAAQQATGG